MSRRPDGPILPNADRIDYDAIAPIYDERFRRNQFAGVRATLDSFLARSPERIVEVGCGTGHWLSLRAHDASLVVGLDPADAMLAKARSQASGAALVRGCAEALPFASSSIDRVFCINALHHFADQAAFVREAGRVLRPGGGLLTVGLDPHTGVDAWWIYDYFPAALNADRRRYAPTGSIRDWFGEAGLIDVSTELAQHIPAKLAFADGVEQGFLDRRSTSQFQVIDDTHWEAGFKRLQKERPVLHADLRLYATFGTRP